MRGRERVVIALLMGSAAIVFIAGINWGLPSRSVNGYLFGDHPVWSGARIAQLAPADTSSAADVDANPIAGRDKPIVLNATDQQRAEIIQRYRLFSYQPDEMITLRSLSQIKRHKGDPRLYQYGGLWIYPVGALLQLASRLHLIELRNDRAFYLDHPEEFGRFYIVARIYAAAFGVVGAWAVYWLARRLSGSLLISAAAVGCYIFMPVVINMAHEAKPHLPGAVLMLLAIIAAQKYVERGRVKWVVMTGALCGTAFGMILSAAPIFLILPVMVFLRDDGKRIAHFTFAATTGITVYFLTNPYVGIHLLGDRSVLRANLQNSTAMYGVGGWIDGLKNAVRLICQGMSLGLAATTALAAAAMWRLSLARPITKVPAIFWLLITPAIAIFIQFAALAAGKPAEYARFAVFIAIALMILACAAVGTLVDSPRRGAITLALIVLVTAIPGSRYVYGFILDSRANTPRLDAAGKLEQLGGSGDELTLAVEPAPYSSPPMDLFRWKIVLPPRGEALTPSTVVAIQTVDRIPRQRAVSDKRFGAQFSSSYLSPFGDKTPISWAAKPFRVLLRAEAAIKRGG